MGTKEALGLILHVGEPQNPLLDKLTESLCTSLWTAAAVIAVQVGKNGILPVYIFTVNRLDTND